MANLDFNAGKVTPAKGSTANPINEQPRNTARVWSPMQENVFRFVRENTGNALIEAVAGSGKSTTIVEAMKMARGNSIFLAFNKSIAEELKQRGVNAKTFHGLTYMPVMNSRKQNNVEQNKLRKLTTEKLTGEDLKMYGSFIQRLVSLGKGVGVGVLCPDLEQTWMDLVILHDMELEDELADLGRALELASELLKWNNESPLVDFDDMLYFAVKDGLSLPKPDFIFVDEAQDTNPIQRAILRKMCKPTTRVIAVGDPAQAIYGFRGASADALEQLASEFKMTTLPLSVTYRCPVSVVREAREWVQHIEPAPNAPEGQVMRLGKKWEPTDFQPNDLVVCRTTAPILFLGWQMLKKRLPVRIMGKDIGVGLKNLIKKMKALSLVDLEVKLEAYTQREVEKATAKMLDDKAEAIQDKTNAILMLIEGLTEDQRTIEALVDAIDALFNEKTGVPVLSTIHKAKGLEANRVFWMKPERRMREPGQAWQVQQERNLCYVAVTRAKQELYFIDEKGARDER